MSAGSERRPPADVAGILSTPVYGETLTVLHVAPSGPSADLAARVAAVQTAAGWRSAVRGPDASVPQASAGVDAVVLWGLQAGNTRTILAGRWPTVLVLGAADARTVLTRPVRWFAELRHARNTNLLLLPVGSAERYTRWGPPVPVAHLPDGLPCTAAVAVLSAWVARAYAYGRRPDVAAGGTSS